jgi:hypothetical protein
MATRLQTTATAVALSAILTLSAGVARADVTLEQRISFEGAGLMSVGNMSGTMKTTISGDRSRTDNDLQMQSRLMRMLAHGAGGPNASIVRLDQGEIYQLDLNKKQYTQMSFDDLRAQRQKAMDAIDRKSSNQQAAPKPLDESKCEWLEPKADVKRTGEKATVAGFDAERVIINASQPCKDKETGAICEVALSLDEWLAPTFPAAAEASKFHRAYAQKMGFDTAYSQDVSERAQSMFSRYKGIWTPLASKIQDVKGYPVKMAFTFALGGEQCKNPQAPQQQGGGNESSANSGSLTSQIGGKIAGALFHRKQDAAAQSGTAGPGLPTPASALPPGLVRLVTISSELVSASTDAASPGVFEVPADFKKIEKKTDK